MTINSLTCPVCKNDRLTFVEEVQLILSTEKASLLLCSRCGTMFTPNVPVPEYHESTSSIATKFYVEFGAGLYSFACVLQNLDRIWTKTGRASMPELLDIGCGFGFLVDMADFRGWKSAGVDPSPIAAEGQIQLNADIRVGYLESNPSDKLYDIVLSSEVIEHVPKPDEFISLVSTYLRDGGIFVMTTPNAGSYEIESASERREILQPGVHLALYSPKSLRILVQRAGFNNVSTSLSEGTTSKKRITLYASKSDQWQFTDHNFLEPTNSVVLSFLDSYLTSLANERKNVHDVIYDGAIFRLVELLTNRAQYARALLYAKYLEENLQAKGIDYARLSTFVSDLKEKSFDDYISDLPAFSSRFLYYEGMMHLNYTQNHRKAAELFELATELFEIEEKLPHFNANSGWSYRAEYLQGLALLYGQRRPEAILVFDKLLTQSKNLPNDVLAGVLWRHLQLGHLQAVSNLIRLFLRKSITDQNFRKMIFPHLGRILVHRTTNFLRGKRTSEN